MHLLSAFILYGLEVSIQSLFNDTLTSFDVITAKRKGKINDKLQIVCNEVSVATV